MSIFKETLDPGIQTQLQARTLVVNGINNNRSGLLPWYLSKNAWVRMTSFVNFTEGTLYLDGTGSIKVNPVKGYYKGNELSKKYILQGGTLYTSESGDQTLSSLRYGVATGNAVYGSNIDARPSGKADPNYFRQLGIRPMPGITDVRMRTIGAYGSLFETTVNFHAWDTNQLNELEILFMRPGYSVLLEWGWSQYLNYNESLTGSMSTLTEDQLESQIFSGQTINPFNNSLVPESVYEELERLRKKHRYNYDGMLGYVKNFNWKLRRDGGYDCSTTLISMGEVINTIKMNTSANQTIAGQDKLPSDDEVSSYVYDDYENVLLSLKSEVEATTQGALQQNGVTISSANTYVSESGFFGKWEKNINYISIDKIKETLKLNKYNAQADYLGSGTEITKNPFYQYIENTSDTNYGTRYEYLTLDVVVAIIASYCNVKARNIGETQEKKQSSPKDYPFVKILVPTDNDFCLAGKDTISVQPSICNVYNPGAFSEEIKYFTFPGGAARTNGKPIYDPKRDGVVPTIHSFKKPFYDKTIKAGRTNRILVNIDFLLSVYRDLKSSPNESGVLMTDYLKNILNKISNSLGGLNNFILSTAGRDQNTLRIIDTYYFGQEKKDSTYQFDLLGLGSICKDVSIQSQIFQEQSTIVAIAAQSKANLADVYNSTQIYLNAGLEDRLAVAKWQGSEIDTRTEDVNDPFYIKLAQLMVYARSYLIGYTTQRDTKGTVKVADSGEDPHTLLKQALLRYDGEMNFKALIPFKLRITLEGIGGIVVGQIFTVKQNILPKNYYDKKLGFVITQIEHVLNNNQWETVLDTQICILDQQSFYDNNGDSLLTLGIQRKGFGEALLKRQILGLIWPVLIDFMIYQATRSYIGYIYASFESRRGSFINLAFLDDTYNVGDINEYWSNNAGLFINRATARGASLNTHKSTLSQITATYSTVNQSIFHANGMGFEEFFVTWFKIWTLQNPDKLNIQYSQNKTLGQVVEFVTGQNYLLNSSDVEYQNFKLYLDEAKRFVDGFNVNALVATAGSPIYDPPGDNISEKEIQQVIAINQNPEGFYRAASGTRYYEVLGWKWKTLVERIEDLILSFQSDKLSTIKTNYNSPLVFSLKSYFVPNSSVMYNESNSMTGIRNVNVDKNGVKGDILDIFSFKGDGSESKVKDQYWANSILWTSDYIEINPTTNQQTQKTITANDGTVAKSIFSEDPANSGLSIGQNNKFWQAERG